MNFILSLILFFFSSFHRLAYYIRLLLSLLSRYVCALRVWLNFVTLNSISKKKKRGRNQNRKKWSKYHRGQNGRPKENWWCRYVTQFVFRRSIYLNVISLYLSSFPFFSSEGSCSQHLIKYTETVSGIFEMGPMWFKTMKQTPFQHCAERR